MDTDYDQFEFELYVSIFESSTHISLQDEEKIPHILFFTKKKKKFENNSGNL